MRTPIIAGNWKMNTTVSEAIALAKSMVDPLNKIGGVSKVFCPPFVSLVPLSELLKGSTVQLGAQNMYFQEKGAYTGEVSPAMLAPLCQYVILGHSERRQYFGETDEIVNKKVKAALKFGITPIVCVGERLEENEAGRTADVVSRQVRGAFDDVPTIGDTVIAYEPVWAIGTGRSATADQANATIGLIRDVMGELFGKSVAEDLRIQYGGSVTAANAAELLSQPQIDGALVGGASLKAEEFISIVSQSAQVKGHK